MRSYLVIGALLLGFACGKTEKVSFSTAEESRQIARNNAMFNAQTFRTERKLPGVINFNGDSTIALDCPQGDGWATQEYVAPDGIKTKWKCSTVSAAIGCMTEEEYKTKVYANEDGSCNENIPFPLPKLGGK